VLLSEAAVNALIDQNCVCPSFRAISQAVWVYILAVGEPALLARLSGYGPLAGLTAQILDDDVKFSPVKTARPAKRGKANTAD
jgi:hypothetical protein